MKTLLSKIVLAFAFILMGHVNGFAQTIEQFLENAENYEQYLKKKKKIEKFNKKYGTKAPSSLNKSVHYIHDAYQIEPDTENHVEDWPKLFKQKSWLVVRAGFTMNDFDGCNGGDMGYDVSVGLLDRGFFGSWYYMPEIGVGYRGFTANTATCYGNEMFLTNHNVRIKPLQFGYLYYANPMLILDMHAGLYASYDYISKLEYREDTSAKLDYLNSIMYKPGSAGWYSVREPVPSLRRYDVGMSVGVGMFLKRFNLDCTYERGFVNLLKGKSSCFSQFCLQLGYAF